MAEVLKLSGGAGAAESPCGGRRMAVVSGCMMGMGGPTTACSSVGGGVGWLVGGAASAGLSPCVRNVFKKIAAQFLVAITKPEMRQNCFLKKYF